MFIKILLVAIFLKSKQKSKINLNIFYLIQYTQNIMVSIWNQYKILDRLHSFCHTKSYKLVCILYFEHISISINHMWLMAAILDSLTLAKHTSLDPRTNSAFQPSSLHMYGSLFLEGSSLGCSCVFRSPTQLKYYLLKQAFSKGVR